MNEQGLWSENPSAFIELVEKKRKHLKDPKSFLEDVIERAASLYRFPGPSNLISSIVWEATLILTSVMREEELDALNSGLKRIWIEVTNGLSVNDPDRKKIEMVLSNVERCLEARTTSVFPKSDEGDMLG